MQKSYQNRILNFGTI